MKKMLVISYILFVSTISFAGGHDPHIILSMIGESKISLLQGIDLAEKISGPATSAKFEVADDGKLALSIYTIPGGLNAEPENAALTELSGDPTAATFQFAAEIFADKAHIARAAVHMTLFQLSKMTLKQVIELALRKIPGKPLDIRNPKINNKRPVADVIVGVSNDKIFVVTVDLLNGKTKAKELN